MKKIVIFILLGFTLVITSCKKLTDLNVDPKAANEVPSETLFLNGLRNLSDQTCTPNNNSNVLRLFAQYWSATDYPQETNYNLTTRQIPDFEFRNIYRDVLMDLKEAQRVVDKESSVISTDAQKKNKKAICEILSVYAYHRLVNIFGNIPYSEALDINNITPKYDDAQSVYAALFARLDAAIGDLNTATGSFGAADLVYKGDVAKWKKFANTLKVRMAINVADVPALDPGAKITAAVASGVFTSSTDNAAFEYLGAAPNTNPIWVNLVSSNRNDWVASNTIVDIMNALSDPRRPKFFQENLGAGVYKGGVYGSGNPYDDFTHITTTIQQPTWKGILLDYTEVQFYLAEAVERGLITGTAKTYYDNAVLSSMSFWGVDALAAAAYIAPLAPGDYNQAGTYKEKIGKQAWIAFFDRGDIAWTSYRRLDAPLLNARPGQPIADVPKRYTYPINEQTLNLSNYSQAAGAIGGDNMGTKLFWDKFNP